MIVAPHGDLLAGPARPGPVRSGPEQTLIADLDLRTVTPKRLSTRRGISTGRTCSTC